MWGPALKVLFAALDSRKDSQTSYEKQLYGELLALKAIVEKFDESGGVAVGSVIVTGGGGVLMSGQPFDVGMKNIIVGPEDEGAGETVRMQINCGKPDCPNKEYQ
jgi:hypothetical protein